jgi:hypothetical protein
MALAVAGTVFTAAPAVAATPCLGVSGPCVGGIFASGHYTDKGSRSSFLVWTNQSSFSVTTSDSWFSVSPTSGRGSMSGSVLTVTVQANPNGYDRSGTIRITAGTAKPYIASVFQGGPKGARNSLRLAPSSLNIDAYGSKEEVVVTTNAPGGWTATTSTPWLSLVMTSGKSGNFFRVAYEPNLTPYERVGVVTIQAGTALPYSFVVTQAGSPVTVAAPAPTTAGLTKAAPAPTTTAPAPAPAPTTAAPAPTTAAPAPTTPVIQLQVDRYVILSAAFNGKQRVTTQEKVITAVSSDPTWLKPVAYTGNGTVSFTVAQNKTGGTRTAVITYTAGGQSVPFTVTQSG